MEWNHKSIRSIIPEIGRAISMAFSTGILGTKQVLSLLFSDVWTPRWSEAPRVPALFLGDSNGNIVVLAVPSQTSC